MNKEISNLRVQLRKAEAAERQKHADALYPELAKKHNGKYFRYSNSDSSGKKWWLYFKVVVVIKNSIRVFDNGDYGFDVEAHSFESHKGCMGETAVNFEINRKTGHYLLQQKCTERQYNEAKKRILNLLKTA